MGLTFGRCRDASGPLMDAAMALYRRSFPAHELRLWPDQQAVMIRCITSISACWMARWPV